MQSSSSRLSLGCAILTAAACPAQFAWDRILTPTQPAFGLWPGMAWFAPTGTCILYGGGNGSVASNETWSYDGTTWTQLTPATDPGLRHTFGMCADVQRGVLVMFGGSDSTYTPQGTTWEYAPLTNTWTQRTSSSGNTPGPRYGCSMVHDVARGVSVLYGGWSGSAFTNETWEWNGADWVLVPTANRPSGRDRFAFAYDVVRGKSVLFGGITTSGPSAETWEYDGVDWTLVATPTSPPPRQKVNMAYDLARGVMVMQGGQASGVQLLDGWEYDGVNWRLLPSTPSPARGEDAVVYDVARGVTVVFGGYSTGGTYTQTWEYGRATTARVHRFGVGCTGSGGVPALQAQGGAVPTLGTTFALDVTNLPAAGGIGAVFYGASNYRFGPLWLPLDLALLGWGGCRAYTTPDIGFPFVHAGGLGSTSFAVPTGTQLQGFAFFGQAVSFDAGAPNGQIALSNAVELILN
jgi:Galactose oxidase, central domain